MEDRRRLVARIIVAVGLMLIALGITHNAFGLPLILRATADGRIALPPVAETGVGGLPREAVIYGFLFMGVDTCVFGAILIFSAADLRKGRRGAWWVCFVIGVLHAVGYSAAWIIFEGAVVRPLVMPAAGLAVVGPLVVWHRAFTVE